MKRLFLFAFLIYRSLLSACGNPSRGGDSYADPLASRHIHILHEEVRMTIASGFESTHYQVIYHIETDSSGLQIPFLFFDLRPENAFFQIWVDDNPVALTTNGHIRVSDFPGIDRYWRFRSMPDTMTTFALELSSYCALSANLSKGKHSIRIECKGTPDIDGNSAVNNYTQRFDYAPAAYRSSFPELDIYLDASKLSQLPGTNLGPPQHGSLDSLAHWHFGNLPAKPIEVFYHPTISDFARFLVRLGRLKIWALFCFLTFFLQVLLMRWYRKRYPAVNHSPAMILGCIVLPFVYTAYYSYSWSFIHWAIGPHASRGPGGMGLEVFVIFPLMTGIAILSNWAADSWFKRRNKRKNASSNTPA